MNNSNIDKATYEKIQDGLHGLKEMTRKLEQKQELKIWSDISVPITIKDALTRLSKDELSAIRKRFEIKNASQLKKGELVELLSMKIPSLLETICLNMDEDGYGLVKEIIRNGGYIVEPKLTAHQLEYLRNSGMFFTGMYEGKKILAMPEEIVKNQFFQGNDKQFESIFRRNTEWIKLTQGLLYYYGTLSIDELVDLLNKYIDEPLSVSNYLLVMEHASSYYKQIRMDFIGFSNIRVFDQEKVKREHQMRKDSEFFPFSREQLLEAGEPEYVERNDSYLQFVNFITNNYEISRKEADVIVEECVYATNIGESPSHILQFLQSRIELQSTDMLKACMEEITNLMINSRKWFLKGFTTKELSAVEQKSFGLLTDRKNIVDSKTRKKIGRNDPCPCGSNVKYKRCCGR
ncbi:YecA family protein [Neobacillus massiliamazoniensis]|uniref:SecC motif containing protein n=1 Tax=Neobacillus massiliamazoniensis TaxID=1499688 RepID=A0A0U1NYH2_9BACI|nr:SEC-C metal-binding domain-containing protein [Neobacillus massiliamazoniensis]CRK83033.1 secC motif containing protein [Neobacillus massiliamazoniensis]